jgi:hypothetical protein
MASPSLPSMARVAVAPTKFARGFDGTPGRGVSPVYRVMELHEALSRRYATDAHLVTYVVQGALRQPRVNKAGLPWFGHPLRVEVFFCDIDNPAHASWDARLHRQALAQFDSLEPLQTAGLYFTPHGQRIVQPLAAALPVLEAEMYLHRWLAWLAAAGLDVDWMCRDWTRHFRLPNVVRDGRCIDSPVVLLERMRPLPVAAFAHEVPLYPFNDRSSVPLTVAEPAGERPVCNWTDQINPDWWPSIERIAASMREVQTEWHSLFLAIAGTLLACGADPEELPLLCRAISHATGADDRPDDRAWAGRSTAERFVQGLPIAGFGTLRRRWPVVAEAFRPPPPMSFRELTRVLDAVGGARTMATLLGWERREIVKLLQQGRVPGEQAAVIRSVLKTHSPVPPADQPRAAHAAHRRRQPRSPHRP